MKKAENLIVGKDVYGKELVLDIYDCDPKTIREKKYLKAFVDGICKEIGMEKYGKCYLPYFGLNAEHTPGYSLLQFIETSSITGHFAEATNSAYINIFSCKDFDAKKAADFCKKFFKARKIVKRVYIRK